MFLRTYKTLWRLSAQTRGKMGTAIFIAANSVYAHIQRSSYRPSFAHDLVALLAKAKTGTEIFHFPKWNNSFISPLLGPPRDGVRAPFFWLTFDLKRNAISLHSSRNTLFQIKALTGFDVQGASIKTQNAIGISYV